MNIIPITPTTPACFGVVCPKHQRCSRYHAAEGTPLTTIDTCEEADGGRPLYVPTQAEQGRAAA